MKLLKYICLMLLLAFVCACDKNEITYDTHKVDDQAEFQLHYFVPVDAKAVNYITKVEVDGSVFAGDKTPLATYNAIPSGQVGIFFSTEPGTVNLKLYQGKGDKQSCVYDQNCTLQKGKQNVFVHSFSAPPIVFELEYPYKANVTTDTDSACWVKFYNFLYEDNTTPSKLKLQYLYEDSQTKELINIGDPVAFGETTGWQEVKIIKKDFNSEGNQILNCKIKVIDEAGVASDLMLLDAKNVMSEYKGTFNGTIGRRYHRILGGVQTAKPIATVRGFVAL